MVTFEVLPDEEEQAEKNVHPLVELEGKLRRVEQIESDRNAKKAERKNAAKILGEIVNAASKETLALPKIATPLLRLICRLFHDDSGNFHSTFVFLLLLLKPLLFKDES